MSPTPEFTDAQLLATRAAAWHQAGDPLITLEAARTWVSNFGLVLFAPRSQALGAPAPSFVEATLGAAIPSGAGIGEGAATPAQSETALGLLARMVSEGSAVPLNLLGGPGDVPDFVASSQVFSFCYTLRGDKAWKQPPAQIGAVKVSTLALRVFETLTERGAMTAHALASELGREVTETAIVRALGELWAQLRVLPRHAGGEGTIWELTTQRFSKAVKAGSNAGLPTALSALVSLYLHQATAASEDEVESFLSPLTARSRIREVVHALSSARELETVAVEGKTLLYVADALPEFAVIETAAEPLVDTEQAEATARSEEGRISRFDGAGARGGNLRGKPVRSSTERTDRSRPATPRRDSEDRPRRTASPGRESRAASGERPSAFTRPWDEERRSRPAAAGAEGEAPKRPYQPRTEGAPDRPARSFKPRTEGAADRPARPFRPRAEGASDRPERTFKPRSEGTADRPPRPYTPRGQGAGDHPARPFRPRAEGTDDRGAARPFRPGAAKISRPGAFRRDEGSGSPARSDRPARPYAGKSPAGERGTRPSAGAGRPFRPRAESREGEPRREYKPRTDFGGKPGARPSSRPERGDRSPGSERPWKPRPDREGTAPARPFTARPSGDRAFKDRPSKDRPINDRPYQARPRGTDERSERPAGRPKFGTGGSRFTKAPGGFAKTSGEGETNGGFARGPRPEGRPKPYGGSFSEGRGRGSETAPRGEFRPSRPRPTGTGGEPARAFSPRSGASGPSGSRAGGPRREGARPGGARPSRPGFSSAAARKAGPGGGKPRAPRRRDDAPQGGA